MNKQTVMCQNGLIRQDNRLEATLAETDHRGWKEGGTLTSSPVVRITEGLTGPRFMRVETNNTLYIIPSDNFLSKKEWARRLGY